MERIAIYYRVSTDKQDLASQENMVEKWLTEQTKKPKSVQIFKDEGISGKEINRPGFQAMMQLAFQHRIDTIVVYRLDRFSRDANVAIRTILELDQHGVAFVSVSQPVLNLGHDMPFRRTLLAAFAEIAELERETIVERVKSGIEAARKRGVRLGAPVKLTKERYEEARRLRDEGLSFKGIGKRLEISAGSVHTLLKSAIEDLPAETAES